MDKSRKISLKVILLMQFEYIFSISLTAKLKGSLKAKDTGLRAKKPCNLLARRVTFWTGHWLSLEWHFLEVSMANNSLLPSPFLFHPKSSTGSHHICYVSGVSPLRPYIITIIAICSSSDNQNFWVGGNDYYYSQGNQQHALGTMPMNTAEYCRILKSFHVPPSLPIGLVHGQEPQI